MENSNIQIAIENPCDKISWRAMSDFERGKFCSICSKNVIDFTKMTDAEIVTFLNKSDESVCAKLNQSQMNRILFIDKSYKIKHWNKIIATLALMAITTVSYSNTVGSNNFITKINKGIFLDSFENNVQGTVLTDSISKIIKGKVVEEGWNQPVKTTVMLKGTTTKVDTDDFGDFEIVVPENYNLDIVTLVVEPTGLEDETEMNFKISELPIYDLIIEKNATAIGTVMIIRKKKWWQFWIKRVSYR